MLRGWGLRIHASPHTDPRPALAPLLASPPSLWPPAGRRYDSGGDLPAGERYGRRLIAAAAVKKQKLVYVCRECGHEHVKVRGMAEWLHTCMPSICDLLMHIACPVSTHEQRRKHA